MSTAKTFVEHGIEEGLRQGIILGKLEGKVEGKLEGQFEVAQRLIFEGVDLRFVQKVTDLPLEELQALIPINP